MTVYHTHEALVSRLPYLPELPRPARILLTTPDHFSVAYVINPHMAGHVGGVDAGRARAQWRQLHDTYRSLGFAVDVLPGVAGLPDMVFCANQTLPVPPGDAHGPGIVASNMFAPERRPEVPHLAAFFERQGYRVMHLPGPGPASPAFEGMGDVLWHPERRLLLGGYGFRTTPEALTALAALLETPVAALRLSDPDFYHLDTCLCLLDDRHALFYPPAFDDAGRTLLAALIPNLIPVPEPEARHGFACNAHCPDGRHVLIHPGAVTTERRLRDAGFHPLTVDTGEFLKAGGSVFCMKLMFW